MRYWKFWLGWCVAVLVVIAGAVALVLGTRHSAGSHPASSAAARPAASRFPRPAGAPSPPPAAPRFSDTGFQPGSVTFVSADEGWTLGSVLPCPAAACPALRHTADGGRSWLSLPAPPAQADTLVFADPRDGWAYGQGRGGIWSTHDGGGSWHPVDVPGVPAGQFWSVAEASGQVRAATVAGGSTVLVLSSPVASDHWTVTRLQMQLGGGPVPTAQLVLSGDTGWLVVDNRVVQSGARLVGGAWTPWTPPCQSSAGPVSLAAASVRDVAALCQVGLWSDWVGNQLYTSADGGVGFHRVSTVSPQVGDVRLIGEPTAEDIVVGVDNRLLTSSDGGYHWTATFTAPAPVTGDSGFAGDGPGYVVLRQSDAAHATTSRLLLTRDRGRTWIPVTFAS
jgi:hypothetical protein